MTISVIDSTLTDMASLLALIVWMAVVVLADGVVFVDCGTTITVRIGDGRIGGMASWHFVKQRLNQTYSK